MNLASLSLKELSLLIQKKEVSIQEVSRFYWERSQQWNPQLNAWISFNEKILEQAQECDEKIQHIDFQKQPLYGLPLGIKDMFCTQGLKTTAASKILSNFVPPYDATVIQKLKKAGALILGKLNQDEFAMGSSNETSYFGVSRNPWNLDYVPGGSSGGSAAAMAARLCPGTIGTDTGGSIRQPAHFCGIVGVKPTYGRISRYGIVSFASSLDQAGPMVATVEDAALMLEAMCGHDPKDQTTANQAVPSWSQKLNPSIKGRKIGILKEYSSEGSIDPQVQKAVDETYAFLKSEGAELVEISVPMVSHGVSVYYLVASSEASSNLARYDGVRFGYRAPFENLSGVSLDDFYERSRGEGFGPEVKSRIMLGTYCLSAGYYDAYYKKASQVRRLMRDQFLSAFEKCDVIVAPVSTSPAFAFGQRIANPLQMYLNDIFTVSANLAGLPGMSVPVSKTKDNLPIGIQIMGRHFDEETMLNVGYAIEQNSKMKGQYVNELP
jgi:aspartyl-tRNA(Asn)/glutamyl-tRNA(Gln) amidotransferase subunit A